MKDARQKKKIPFSKMPREGKGIKSESRLAVVWGLGWERGMTANRLEEFLKNLLPIMPSAFSVTSSVYWLKRAQPDACISPWSNPIFVSTSKLDLDYASGIL